MMTKKMLPTEARYLSKETAELLRADIAKEEAREQAKKAAALEKKAAAVEEKAAALEKETAAAAKRVLHQLATAAFEGGEGGQRQRLPQRSKAKKNYLLQIVEDVFK
jgi:septal ring-binding cell division protein DamX